MKQYSVRSYRSADGGEFYGDFRRMFPGFPITEETFLRKTLLDPNFDPEGMLYLLDESGRKVGMAYAQVLRLASDVGEDYLASGGNLSFFRIAEPAALADGGADLLLNAAEEFLRSRGKTSVAACGGTCYFHPGISLKTDADLADFFRTRGYNGTECISQDADLSNYVMPEKLKEKQAQLAAEGIYTGPLTRELYLSFLSVHPYSRPSWVAQFRKRVLFAPMDFDRVQVAARGGEVIGGVLFGDPDSSPERFGPFGVNPEEQGHGIGSVLLALCLQEMRRRGLFHAWMQSADTQGPAFTIYKRAGFKETERFVYFKKAL